MLFIYRPKQKRKYKKEEYQFIIKEGDIERGIKKHRMYRHNLLKDYEQKDDELLFSSNDHVDYFFKISLRELKILWSGEIHPLFDPNEPPLWKKLLEFFWDILKSILWLIWKVIKIFFIMGILFTMVHVPYVLIVYLNKTNWAFIEDVLLLLIVLSIDLFLIYGYIFISSYKDEFPTWFRKSF